MTPRVASAITAALCLAGSGCGATGATRLEYSPFHDNRHNAIVRVATVRPQVAITFDDGPDRRFTPALLRLLRENRVHATFFDIGRPAVRNRALIAAELRDGHEIGNHTLAHVSLTRVSPAAVHREIQEGASAIKRSGAPRPWLFRPPWGAFDETVGAAAAAEHELMVGWDLPLDRYIDHGPVRTGVKRLLEDVRPGSIVLVHAERSWHRARTLRALLLLINGLRGRGYAPVTVGELLRSVGRV